MTGHGYLALALTKDAVAVAEKGAVLGCDTLTGDCGYCAEIFIRALRMIADDLEKAAHEDDA